MQCPGIISIIKKNMKYKKQLATGALAISLLVGGSSVFASTPRDLGIKKDHQIYQRQDKNAGMKHRWRRNTVGTVASINGSSFMVEIKNRKTGVVSSAEVKTNTSTAYQKNGIDASASDLAVGQKVVVVGNLDKTTNIMTAKAVKIVTLKNNIHKAR